MWLTAEVNIKFSKVSKTTYFVEVNISFSIVNSATYLPKQNTVIVLLHLPKYLLHNNYSPKLVVHQTCDHQYTCKST